MGDLYDESVRQPARMFWIGLAGLAFSGGIATWVANTYLFPAEDIALTTLPQIVAEEQGPLVVSADEQPTAVTTSLRTVSDTIRGFQVGVPGGWSLRATDGPVVVTNNSCGSASALFYPVELIDQSLAADTLLRDVWSVVASQVSTRGGSLTLGEVASASKESATSLIIGSACGATVEGAIQATTQGNQALVKLHWFPTDQKLELTSVFAKLLQSYRSTVATPLPLVDSGRLRLALAEGWTEQATEQSLAVQRDNLMVKTSTISFPSTESLDTALASWLQLERDAGAEFGDFTVMSETSASNEDSRGNQWNSKSQEVRFTRGQLRYSGLLTAAYTDALGNAAWLLWRSAPESDWSAESSRLTAIETSAMISEDATLPITTRSLTLPTTTAPTGDATLSGQGFRAALQDKAMARWQPRLDSFVRLTSSSKEEFFASIAARQATTGVYSATINGQITTLTPIAEGTDGN